jgi:hypothetical protein
MKNLLILVGLMSTLSSHAQSNLTCFEMDAAASALAKVNGATFATPSYRLAEIPLITDVGAEFNYQFDAMESRGDEAPNKKVGIIKVVAFIKSGETKCKVLSLSFSENE